ncbi:serine racemase-like isoform X8 [Narcine bancroftii]|uniref:serine racemase-like isoform X8 n=1 Tax=Narcine bancroftii TaxID=1343680 RepID=UPI00383216DC
MARALWTVSPTTSAINKELQKKRRPQEERSCTIGYRLKVVNSAKKHSNGLAARVFRAPPVAKMIENGESKNNSDRLLKKKSRVETAYRTIAETQGILVHPNQDPLVIAGQGTIGLEILQQVPDVQAVVAPVGGGGLISGIAVAIKTQRPEVKIYAAEPENADDCYWSKRSGRLTPNASPPVTLADAVKTSIGANTWPIIRDLVDDVFTVSEEEIQNATRLIWERAKLVIEPTAGLGVAAVLSQPFRDIPSSLRKVCVVLCGGNVDLDSLQWLGVPSGTD